MMKRSLRALGRYLLLERIAQGGMGEVYMAASPGAKGLFKFVAIKRIIADVARKNEQFRSMFEFEGRIGLSLSHNNLLQMYEASTAGEELFFVMEYVNGINLDRVLHECRKKNTPMPLNLALYVATESAKAIAYAHSYVNEAQGLRSGIIHQDISPHNIMLGFNGCVKVIDFGVANAHAVKGKIAFGKARYMSPEQQRFERATARSDVFSLGVTIWEMVCGHRLFEGDSPEEVKRKAGLCIVPPMRGYNPAVSERLDAIVRRATSKNAADRYPTASELLNDLVALVGDEGHLASPEHLTEYMAERFPDEKARREAKLTEYGRDLLTVRLPRTSPQSADSDVVGLGAGVEAAGADWSTLVTDLQAARLESRLILLDGERCFFSNMVVTTANGIRLAAPAPPNFRSKECVLIVRAPGSAVSKAVRVRTGVDGLNLLPPWASDRGGDTLADTLALQVPQAS